MARWHMSIDVSGIPLPEPDPPMDASLQQLRECRAQTADKLSAAAQPDSKMETEEVGTIARQFKRVNDRILQHEATSSGDKQLPEQLLFTDKYKHLSEEQIDDIKEVLRDEAGFFMKGKYPKVIKPREMARIDVGAARPRSSGYRRLSESEQEIVNEYVERLIAADVIEPMVKPILLVAKKDGGLRAVADLRKVNECVVSDSYPMPDVHELLDQLSGANGLVP